MKDNHPIDNMFREGLASRKMTPPAGAWAAIEANVQEKGSKKGLFFYLAIAASVSLVCAVTWTNLKTTESTSPALETATIQKELPTINLKASNSDKLEVISLPAVQTGKSSTLTEIKDPVLLPTTEERTVLVAGINSVNKIDINTHSYLEQNLIRNDISLNMSAFVTAPEILEESKGFKFNFIRGLASVARGVDDGKKAIGSMRKSKIEFVNEGLKYGKSEESQKTQATIDEDSPSDQK